MYTHHLSPARKKTSLSLITSVRCVARLTMLNTLVCFIHHKATNAEQMHQQMFISAELPVLLALAPHHHARGPHSPPDHPPILVHIPAFLLMSSDPSRTLLTSLLLQDSLLHVRAKLIVRNNVVVVLNSIVEHQAQNLSVNNIVLPTQLSTTPAQLLLASLPLFMASTCELWKFIGSQIVSGSNMVLRTQASCLLVFWT